MKESKRNLIVGTCLSKYLRLPIKEKNLCNIIHFKFKGRTKLILYDAPDTGQIELQTRTKRINSHEQKMS